MSVASEINRIKSNIADAYDEAEAKGATMPATENSANLADTVASIQSTPTLQSKTVTPTTSQQSVTPDSGYDGLSDVTVNATPLETATITPTTQEQTITPTSPNIGFSSVTVEAYTPPDPDGVLVLVDWEGTPIASYTHSEAMALTSLPNAPDLPFYANVDHEYLSFQEWTHTLQEVKDYLQYRPYGHLLVGAIYTTTDGQDHKTYTTTRSQAKRYLATLKTASLNSNDIREGTLLQAVNAPNNVTGSWRLFELCRNIKTIIISRNLQSMSTANFFKNCNSLKSIIFPPTFTGDLKDDSFNNCYSLSYIVIPEGVKNIGITAFIFNSSLQKVEIPKSIETIGASAFAQNSCILDVIIKSKPTAGNSSVFDFSNPDMKIYCPRENLSYFETATNWASMYTSTRFVAIEDNIDYLEHIGCDVHEYKEAQT